MSRRTATRRDHQKFCQIEGWKEVRSARGRTGTHHITYELALPDGRILRTRVSRPPNRSDIGAGLFAHVLRDQLQVTADEFFDCVDNGNAPARTRPTEHAEALPPEIVHLLANKVGLEESAIRRLTKDEAVQVLNDYWASGRQ